MHINLLVAIKKSTWNSKWECKLYCLIAIAVKKGFGDLKIASFYNISIDASYDIQESWSFIWIIRTVKSDMSWHFNISTSATD